MTVGTGLTKGNTAGSQASSLGRVQPCIVAAWLVWRKGVFDCKLLCSEYHCGLGGIFTVVSDLR